jgi:hypothetical protein
MDGLARATSLSEHAKTAYAEVKAACEARVVRWEWWTSVAHSYEPAYFEIAKVRRGHPLAAELGPTTRGAHGYGIDAEGQVAVERQQTSLLGRYYETFFVPAADGIAAYHYSYDPAKEWINVRWLAVGAPGVVENHAVFARGTWQSVTYQYDDQGRVVGCRRRGTNPPYGDLADSRAIEYDDAGRIAKVYWIHEDGRRHLDFELPAPNATLAACEPLLVKELTRAMIDALRELALDDAVYCVALAHCDAEYQYRMPPHLHVGRAAERARFRAEHGDEAPEYIWNPAEWAEGEVYVTLSPELARLCDSVSQDIWQNELDADAARVLGELAAAIEAAELPCRRAEPFAAVVIDLDQGDAAAQVAAQVGAETAEAMRVAGWL